MAADRVEVPFKAGDRVVVIPPATGGMGGRYYNAGDTGVVHDLAIGHESANVWVKFDASSSANASHGGIWCVDPASLVHEPSA